MLKKISVILAVARQTAYVGFYGNIDDCDRFRINYAAVSQNIRFS
jgi:hypothetical protein